MRLSRDFSALALLLTAACSSNMPDSTPITYWALRPAEVPLTGIRVLNVAPKTAAPETQLASRLREDLLSTERFSFSGGAAQGIVSVAVEPLNFTSQIESAPAQSDLTTLTRYTRWVSYTLRGTLNVVDAMTSAPLATIQREVPASHECGSVVLPGMPPPSGQPDPRIFANSEPCAVGNEAVAGVGRMLAQSLVPHYEMESAQLYTLDLGHADEAVKAFNAGSWTEAENLLRVDLQQATDAPEKSGKNQHAKASYNLAVLLNATGQTELATEQLKNTVGMRDSQAYKLAELSIGRANTAATQAKSSGYTPHHLPAL